MKDKRRQTGLIGKPIQYVKVITLSDTIFSMRYGARAVNLNQNR